MFVLGDFNIDLLQYESYSYTNDFFNTMISSPFLPYIHQPTRVTDHSDTVLDNIFSNISDYETVSGNIASSIADHFAQFLLIKTCYFSFKSGNYHVSDNTKFGREKLIHDFSVLDWSAIDDPSVSVNDHFDFLIFFEKLIYKRLYQFLDFLKFFILYNLVLGKTLYLTCPLVFN